ncbi:MAG: zinc transporter ZupT [Desulfurivibrionaceae bacterium]
MEHNVLFAFSLTLLAGLATGIGSALAFLTRRTNTGFLATALGFSAGVMIYISFVEILKKAQDNLEVGHGEVMGNWYSTIAFFGGIALILIIDQLVPSYENPHEAHVIEEMEPPAAPLNPDLMRMGVMSALAIGIHNFPEGLATFTAALTDQAMGISIAAAIAIHNIPEGISVSVPIYYATGSRKKAFYLSFLSGISEPVGALIGYGALRPFMNETILGLLFASVAGIMVFISLDELLPTARKYCSGHNAVYGLICGMAVMALSLLLFL